MKLIFKKVVGTGQSDELRLFFSDDSACGLFDEIQPDQVAKELAEQAKAIPVIETTGAWVGDQLFLADLHGTLLCQLGATLGAGAFGSVLQGRMADGQAVAVKQIPLFDAETGLPLTPEKVQNILLEATVMEALGDHPHTLRTMGSVIANDKNGKPYLFLFMTLAEHGSLEKIQDFFSMCHSETGGVRPLAHIWDSFERALADIGVEYEDLIIYMLKQALEGAKHLHDNKYCHRDLKRGNLVLDKKGRLKLADYGLCRQYLNEVAMKSPEGTPTCIPWEVQNGMSKDPELRDIWALGNCFTKLRHGYFASEVTAGLIGQGPTLRPVEEGNVFSAIGRARQLDAARRTAYEAGVVNLSENPLDQVLFLMTNHSEQRAHLVDLFACEAMAIPGIGTSQFIDALEILEAHLQAAKADRPGQ
ncbi:MAG: hypothetical protein ACI9BD_000099 [Candidatus Marinamargulisbacteria bacterium]|jgi:hypothetical protein